MEAGPDRVPLTIPFEIHQHLAVRLEAELAQRLKLKLAPVTDSNTEIDRGLTVADRRTQRDRARRNAIMDDVDKRSPEIVPVELQLEGRLRIGRDPPLEQQWEPRDRALSRAVASNEHGEWGQEELLGPLERAVVLERKAREVPHEGCSVLKVPKRTRGTLASIDAPVRVGMDDGPADCILVTLGATGRRGQPSA